MAQAQPKQVSPVVVAIAIVVVLVAIGLIYKFTLFPSTTIPVNKTAVMQTMPDGSIAVAPAGFPGLPPPPSPPGGAMAGPPGGQPPR